ncbi:hypothetical protein B0H19DRAFT_1183780 [Mycena capillaripes]|nr:hypothetical protein B0H19DRAFT_1183780 [Mycena capillaripes]
MPRITEPHCPLPRVSPVKHAFPISPIYCAPLSNPPTTSISDNDCLRIMHHPADETRVPAQRPPDEVLALIFKITADLPLGRTESPAPLAISRVSQRWRAVAVSSPEMWTNVCVSGRLSLNTATLFLRRSAPLAFRLSVNTESRNFSVDSMRTLDILLPHIERCSALALCVSHEDLRAWNTALALKHELHKLRFLSIAIHSHAPDELWGPPDSLFHFTALCSSLHTLRLSVGPTMQFHDTLHPVQLTTLDVRCTWDGAFLRHICHHSHVLQTLVLRDYSATVFDSADRASMPSLTSLVLEFRDAALAEGLISLARFLDLPNLSRLAIKGTGTPGVGHPLRLWNAYHFPSLRTLHLRDVVFQRPIDARILESLSAGITHLQLINVHRGPVNDAEIFAAYSSLRVIEIPPGAQMRLPVMMSGKVIVRHIPVSTALSPCDELDYYVQTDGSTADFEREPPAHICSDFCAMHSDSPWRDMRSDLERHLDRIWGQGLNRATPMDATRIAVQ